MHDLTALDFVALDVETANAQRSSVCAVGLAVVRGGRVVASEAHLVVPPTGVDSFSAVNTAIHGLDAGAVRDAQTWDSVVAHLDRLGDEFPLVAYNAPFDRGVYEAATRAVGLRPRDHEWLDALQLVRRVRPDITPPKLPVAARALGVSLEGHHDAEQDAVAAAEIVLALARDAGIGDVRRLWQTAASGEVGGTLQRSRPSAAAAEPAPLFGDTVRPTRVADLPDADATADPGHPLFGHHVVLTGQIPGHRREDVWQRLSAVGAHPQMNVTKKTTIVVCAERQDVEPLQRGSVTPVDARTSKERKALYYAAGGQPIRFMTTSMFFGALDGDVLPAVSRPHAGSPTGVESGTAERRDPRRPSVDAAPSASTPSAPPAPTFPVRTAEQTPGSISLPPRPAPTAEPIVPHSLRQHRIGDYPRPEPVEGAGRGRPAPVRPAGPHVPASRPAAPKTGSVGRRLAGVVLVGVALFCALFFVAGVAVTAEDFAAGDAAGGTIGTAMSLIAAFLAWFSGKKGVDWYRR